MRQLTGFIVKKIANFDGNAIWIFPHTKNFYQLYNYISIEIILAALAAPFMSTTLLLYPIFSLIRCSS